MNKIYGSLIFFFYFIKYPLIIFLPVFYFYLDAQKNDSPTIFSNPFVDMKNPTHTTVRNMKNVVLNDLTYQQCGYSCETGKLVIFRSNISHAVDPKQIKEKRIVFSYNFDPK